MGVCASKPPPLMGSDAAASDAPEAPKGRFGFGKRSKADPSASTTMMARMMRRQSTNIGPPPPLHRGIPGPLALVVRCGLRPALLVRLHDALVTNTVVGFDIRLVLLLIWSLETKWALSAIFIIFVAYLTSWFWLGKFLGAWLAREPDVSAGTAAAGKPVVGGYNPTGYVDPTGAADTADPADARGAKPGATSGLGMVRSFVAYGPVGVAILDVLNLSTALGITQFFVLAYEVLKRIVCPAAYASAYAAATVAQSAHAEGGGALETGRKAAEAAVESGKERAARTSAAEAAAIAASESKSLVDALERRDLIGCFSAGRLVSVALVEAGPMVAMRLWIAFRLAWTGKGSVSHMQLRSLTHIELAVSSYALLVTTLRIVWGVRVTGLSYRDYVGSLTDMGGALPVHALVTHSLDSYALTYAPAASERRALAAALAANRSIRHLSLRGVRLGEDESEAVAHLVYNSAALTTLDLRHNAIGDKGALALAEALKGNSHLQALDLQHNQLSNSSKQLLSEVWKATPGRETGLKL
ncbi:hypothetical protein KFE25_011114 [Diacronema lutheri]|uniref:Uncharacterized protein n=1 Tax=Diacronema lutheri TaxID=2081491 RepID=A0A8J6C608_DIALT|nr:hypothetical protein KFE25_011114 [Diacronema lutheri]